MTTPLAPLTSSAPTLRPGRDRWERPFRYQPARPSSAPQGPLKPPASSSLGRILRASLDTLPSTPAPALRPFARSPLPPVPASPEGPCEEQLARIATLSVVPQIRPMTVEAGPGPASTAAAASHIEKRNGGAGAEDSGPPSRGESGAGGAGDGDEEKPSWVSNDLFGERCRTRTTKSPARLRCLALSSLLLLAPPADPRTCWGAGAKVDGLPGEASSAVLSFTERKGLPPRAVVGGPSTAVR